jgi:hypothetical protein
VMNSCRSSQVSLHFASGSRATEASDREAPGGLLSMRANSGVRLAHAFCSRRATVAPDERIGRRAGVSLSRGQPSVASDMITFVDQNVTQSRDMGVEQPPGSRSIDALLDAGGRGPPEADRALAL